jgi:methylated-DNA-[protein]-cysteine S-methyltransferase
VAADLRRMATPSSVERAATWFATSIGTSLGQLVVVASDRGIVAADLGGEYRSMVASVERRHDVDVRRADRALADVRADARTYFGRPARPLRHPVDLSIARTEFWRGVYEAAIAVPLGELRTYGDVAAAAGSPRAWRATGHALRHCPVELWIPCHRIVPVGPGLGTYGGRPDVREFLLRHEGSLPPPRGGGRSADRTGR